MGSWNPQQLNPGSSASNQKSIKLQTHGAQICKGSSTCPKLLSYHAITLPPHQLFHLTDTFTCSTSNLIYCIICCKCSMLAKLTRLQRWLILNWTLPPNRLCMLAKMPVSRWGMCSSTSRNLMEDKHRGESGCQANQQQSCRFLKGLSAGKECAVPLPGS